MLNRKILAAMLLMSSASVAHAGFFDFLFGSNEEPATAPVIQPAPAAQPVSAASAATSLAAGLLPALTQQLGVTEAQAKGGLGSLMTLAKGSLSTDEFGQLSAKVPNMDTLLAAAPQLQSKGGMSDMLSSAGGLAASLGSLVQLNERFEALGLNPEMIAQFANIAISYFAKNDENSGELLQKGLSTL